MTVAGRASSQLVAHKDALAAAVTASLYLLRARNVSTHEVIRSLELIGQG